MKHPIMELSFWDTDARKIANSCIAFLFAALLLTVQTKVAFASNASPHIRAEKAANYLVDIVERHPGLVIGVKSNGSDWRFVSKGVRRRGEQGRVDTRTVFEIGSVTKVFISVLLLDMAARGEVNLTDSVDKYLPDEKWPEFLEQITLLHLATHSSGLPRRPTNLQPERRNGPYADFKRKDLLDYLKNAELIAPPGSQYQYSNLGVGLLGFFLAEAAGQPLDALMKERIFGPLGMTSTNITSFDSANSASPHDSIGETIVGRWSLGALAGAGGLHSNANDMSRFADALMGLSDAPVSSAAQLTLSDTHQIPGGTLKPYLAWISPDIVEEKVLFSHDGGTGGSRSMIIIEPATNSATIILGNAATNLEHVAMYVHGANRRLPAFEKIREITLAENDAWALVGCYRLDDAETIEITLEDAQLYAQMSMDGRFPVYPYDRNKLFYRVGEAQLIFNFDGAHTQPTSVALQRPWSRSVAPRTAPECADN